MSARKKKPTITQEILSEQLRWMNTLTEGSRVAVAEKAGGAVMGLGTVTECPPLDATGFRTGAFIRVDLDNGTTRRFFSSDGSAAAERTGGGTWLRPVTPEMEAALPKVDPATAERRALLKRLRSMPWQDFSLEALRAVLAVVDEHGPKTP